MSTAPQQDVHTVTQPYAADLVLAAAPAEPAASASRPPLSELFRPAAKRALDVVGAGLALGLLAPLFLLIALLIVLDSPGPVFYRAERVGFRGWPLRMLKLGKMHPHATGGLLTVANDERLT